MKWSTTFFHPTVPFSLRTLSLIHAIASRTWFSGAQKRAEWLYNPCFLGSPQQGDKIRTGYLTPAFSGAEWLYNPCLLGVSNVKPGNKIRGGSLTPTIYPYHCGPKPHWVWNQMHHL